MFFANSSELISNCRNTSNPAWKFLHRLSLVRSTVTIQEFSTAAKEFNRNDIVTLFEGKCKGDELLKDIDITLKQSLCSQLNVEGRGIRNWKSFAEKYSFKPDQITHMAQQEKVSPTEKLIEYVQVTQPDMKLRRLHEICENILKRNDVAGNLKKMIKEIIQTKKQVEEVNTE